MTLYYIKQDDTIWGCGDPGCCGEYQERIEHSFTECKCLPESEMTAEHLQGCVGGGPVLKWRTATAKEYKAFWAGTGEGYSDGYFKGGEIAKARERQRIIKLLDQKHTAHEGDQTHNKSGECTACEMLALIKGENK